MFLCYRVALQDNQLHQPVKGQPHLLHLCLQGLHYQKGRTEHTHPYHTFFYTAGQAINIGPEHHGPAHLGQGQTQYVHAGDHVEQAGLIH